MEEEDDDNDAPPVTTTTTTTTPKRPRHPFKVGDHVSVLPRTWSGMNSLGGVAKVTAVFIAKSGEREYDVSYFHGGRDKAVGDEWVGEYTESPERVTRKR